MKSITINGSQRESVGKKDTKALTDPDAVWGDLTRAHIRLIQTDEPAALSTFLKSAS